MNTNTQIQKAEVGTMTYVPFGTSDPIKLTISIVQKLCASPTRSGKTCSDRDALKFMALCQAQKLNPFAGDAYLIGYDGKDGFPKFSLITAHLAFLKRAETCPDYEGMESGIILQADDGSIAERETDFHLPEEKVVGGWAKVFRKGRKQTFHRLSIAQRKPAYSTPFWEGAKAAEQIVKCAEVDALRATFPTLLGGMYNGSEIIDITPHAAAEVPANRLVDVKPADGPAEPEAAPAPEAEPEAPPKSKQDELSEIVTTAGHTFDQFRTWAKESGQMEDVTSLAGFEDVPEAIAIRCLRAKVGMLRGIAQGGAK